MARHRPDFQIEYVDIESLKLDSANPRRISDAELESLTRSLAQFGFVSPIAARREDRLVIGGHQRIAAARKLGLKTVPVVFLELSVDESRLLNLALNRIHGDWDEEALAHLIAQLQSDATLDLSLSGFGDDEVRQLLRSLDARERRERSEDFDLDAALDAAGRRPRTQLGDLIELGPHLLLCGDAAESPNYARLLKGTEAAMAFADLPYNVDYGNHGGRGRGRKRTIQNDALPPAEWEAFLRGAGTQLLAHTAGAIYACMSSKELPLLSLILSELGGHWSDTIIWAKDSFTLGRADLQRQYEPIWYGWREGTKRQWLGGRRQGDVWNIDRPRASELHPTMKPLDLVERAIENSSRRDDLVLDPFLGSGTTLIACERTSRRCRGIELDPYYCDVIVARWEAFSGMQATYHAVELA